MESLACLEMTVNSDVTALFNVRRVGAMVLVILGFLDGEHVKSLACLEMTVNSDVTVGAMAVGDSWILGSEHVMESLACLEMTVNSDVTVGAMAFLNVRLGSQLSIHLFRSFSRKADTQDLFR
jgi:hypothetical protein